MKSSTDSHRCSRVRRLLPAVILAVTGLVAAACGSSSDDAVQVTGEPPVAAGEESSGDTGATDDAALAPVPAPGAATFGAEA
ncbi:MAG: hypothetical protein ACERLM_10690, partial [Acidimicrobiales bacterium]